MLDSRERLLSQIIDNLSRHNDAKPACQAATMVAFKLAQFLAVFWQQRMKQFLERSSALSSRGSA